MSQVSDTILKQLGGNRFIAMTGAKHFYAIPKEGLTPFGGLTFRIPRSKGINRVSIMLDAQDTYTVWFIKDHGLKQTTMSEHYNVYADQLQSLFTEQTGLYTSLGTMGRSA